MVSFDAREGRAKNWDVWARPEAAESLYAWREIVKALGFKQTIAVNHTYRSALVDVGHAGFARSAVSVHKTGLAIDVGVANNYREPVADWPIVLCRDEILQIKNAKKQVIGHRVLWRLYAPTTLAAAETPEAALARMRAQLEVAKNDRHPLAGVLRDKAGQLLQELGDVKKLYAKYFRGAVQKWNYDAWHDEGGTPGGEVTADVPMRKVKEKQLAGLRDKIEEMERLLTDSSLGADARAAAVADKKALEKESRDVQDELSGMPLGFIDLTAVAELTGLHRIYSLVNKDKPTGTDWGLAAESVSTTNAKVLVDKLASLQTAHSELAIDIDGTSVPLSAFDVALMRRYLDAMTSRKTCAKSGLRVSATVTKGNKKAAEELRDLLADLGDAAFFNVDDKTVATGAYWSKHVDALLNPPDEKVPVNQQDGKSGSTLKTAKTWSLGVTPIVARLPEPASAAATAAAQGAGAESKGEGGITPPGDAAKTEEKPRPLAPHEIVLLPGKSLLLPSDGAPIGMEWWHFQRNDIVYKGTFGDNLAAIGWLPECVEGRRAELHWRAGVGYPTKDLTGK